MGKDMNGKLAVNNHNVNNGNNDNHGSRQEKMRQAYTFEDVLLVPAASATLPNQAEISTRLTRSIQLGIPAHVGGDGHRHRGRDGNCHGTIWRHWCHSPQSEY